MKSDVSGGIKRSEKEEGRGWWAGKSKGRKEKRER